MIGGKVFKKFIAVMLSGVMFMSMTPVSSAAGFSGSAGDARLDGQAATYAAASDIEGHWAEETLERWLDKGWLHGDGQGVCRPGESITRAEFMALINRMKGYEGTSPDIDRFGDVSKDRWYRDTVSAALAAGYLSGTGDGMMSPEKPITRQEAMTVIARIYGFDENDTGILSAASDGAQVAGWARKAVAFCMSEGLVSGSNGRINPGTNITRAESVVLMDRVDAGVRTYAFSGVYGPESGKLAVSSVTIAGSDIALRNMEINQDLTISASVGEGEVSLNNVAVKNNLNVYGGGENTVRFNDVTVENGLIVKKENGRVRIIATGRSSAAVTLLESGAILVARELSSGRFGPVEIPESFIRGQKIALEGKFGTVKNYAGGVQITATGSIENLEVHTDLTLTGSTALGRVTVGDGAVADVNGRTYTASSTIGSGRSSSGGSTGSDQDGEKKDEAVEKDETVMVLDDSEVGFANLNPQDDDDPPLGAPASNYLLYGYNVLKYGYINSDNIKKIAPIFDEKKLKKKETEGDGGNYEIAESTASTSNYLYSKSASSLYEDFDASSSVKYKGLFFSGGIKAEYNLKTAMSEDKVLIKHIQYHKTAEQAYTVSVTTLKTMLSDDFTNDVEKYAGGSAATNPDYDPAYILDYYGTHAIIQYYLGGRSELNFVFNNRNRESEETIQLSVEAAYKGFSGKASASDEKKSKLVMENSSTYFSSVGGKNISGTTAEVIAGKYDGWVDSIKDTPALCGIAGFENSLLPVWELVDGPAAQNLKEAFEEAAKNAQADLSMLDGVPLYITDIAVYSRAGSEDALDQIPNDYTKVLLNPGTSSTEVMEANKGAGGNYIYIAYKLSTDKSSAITDIQIISGDTSGVSPGAGYTKVPVDLNEKARGKYIYLCYKKITEAEKKNPDTKCLKEIRGVYGKSYSVPMGWEWPSNGGTADLNSGCKSSAEVIRLVVRKGL